MSEDALRVARELAAGLDPVAAAARAGVRFTGDARGGRFTVPLLGREVEISYPAFGFAPDEPLPPHVRALLVYYLATSDGSRAVGAWRSFGALPNASFYVQAFQGYTGNTLARRLGESADAIPGAIEALGGRALTADEFATNADSAWLVPALPRVPVAITWWNADEEFPPRAELLFDVTASNHLPTDGCAVLGSWLTTMLLARAEGAGR